MLRLLAAHPHVALKRITSRAEAGRRVAAVYPSLTGRCDLVFEDPDAAPLADCAVVFCAAPNLSLIHI